MATSTPSNKSVGPGGEIRSEGSLRNFSQRGERDDETLLANIATGDSEALSALYDKYQRRIYSLVLKIVRNEDDAAEVMQDVFLQVWEKAGLFDQERGSFGAWLTTLAHNKAINVLRSRRYKKSALEVRQDLEELSGVVSDATIERRTALDEQVEASDREQMLSLLAQIPEAQRQALTMAYYSGYSQTEIADALGVPLGTVKTRMRQGMIKLRDMLTGG
ncbi:MAG: sigma-70 family RNA polymerase sigma factor [Bacteroidetes bacterium]|nr:sigma-70 family RNA polymerase sigma factor [Bacteroidota bacterium]